MTTWEALSAEAPELAAAVQRSFDQGKHKVMATIRRDGSPRVSGTEVVFFAGEVWLGSMPGAMKARDLGRDPRLALHSPPIDETLNPELGDAKLSGRAEEITDPAVISRFLKHLADEADQHPPEPFHLFRVELTEAVRSWVDGDHMVIESWHPGQGVRRVERA